MGGIPRLLRMQARRDRWQLLIWIVGVGLVTLGSAAATATEFGGEKERTALVLLATHNHAILMLRGAPQGIGVGGLMFFELFAFLAVMAGLMSTFLIVRHTRGEEEAGRGELVAAAPVTRVATLVSAVLLALIANLLLVAVIAGAFIASGFDPAGSIVTGLAAGSAGVSFAGIATVAAQLTQTSRAANAIAGSSVGVAYLVRGIGDALGTASSDGLSVTSAWPSWLSPIGWGQQTHAFSQNSLAPLGLSVSLAVVLVACALWIRARRDIGASLFAERVGRERASVALRSSFGLAWRLHWPTVAGWAVGGAVVGGFAGSLGPVVADAVAGNASISKAIAGLVPGGGGSADLQDVFVAAMLGITGFLAAGAGVQAVLRMRGEETAGRAEPVLATSIDRGVWLIHYVVVAAISVLAVALVAGLVCGVTLLASGAGGDRFWGALAAGFAQWPAAFLYVGLIALVFAVVPRLTVSLGWGLLAVGLVIGQLGSLLRLPDWVRDVSPFSHTPSVPVAAFDWTSAVILVAIGLVLTAGAAITLRTRDLVT